MENFLPFLEDKLPFSLLCFLVLFAYSLSGAKIQDRMKIGILYIITYVLLFINLDLRIAIIILLATSFCYLEFFSSDRKKNEDLKISEKIIDYFYTMFFECRASLFAAIVIITKFLSDMANQCSAIDDGLICDNIVVIATYGVCAIAGLFVALLHLISSPKFLKKPYSEIIEKLAEFPVYTDYSKIDIEKFNMLVDMEDRAFLERNVDEHTAFALTTVGGRIKEEGFLGLFKGVWHYRKCILRGYGTIDMQLVRSVGIERGYNCAIRRKIFEVAYSHIIYNSYYRKVSSTPRLFKCWMLRNYIKNVGIKINGKIYSPEGGDVFRRAFKTPFYKLSKDKFFVWILGLRYFDRIGPNVLRANKEVMKKYNINKAKVETILKQFE